MIALGGAVGFGVVFLLVVVAASALGCAVVAVGGRALAARGPVAERRAAALAAVVPPIAGVLVVAALALHSATTIDHCEAHDHHAHLCVAHGGAWLARPWAVAVAAAATVVTIGRAALLLATLVGARARVRTLAAVAEVVDDVRVVDSPRRFCFVAGVRRPAIYASTAALRALADDERAAMLAHERAHVRARDLLWRRALEVATLVAAPLAPGFLARRWDDATERLRDRDAARATDPAAVAHALIAMCRGEAAWAASMNYAPPVHALTRRVEAVLATPDDEPRGARRLAIVAAALGAAVIVALVAFVDPIHHALETLLG
ncbi:MAG: M48 family metalloprotease [Myxococcales bacterium]|nr:M48 family metalloprotease [Myxococcales bacterium]MBP6846196.1 M48 family metalloprotease [Kofleriaceae bacterium]